MRSYAKKEIKRFENPLLYDPIERVARHPLRKMRKMNNGRLIGALNKCILNGIYPINLIKGICSALKYNYRGDDDYKNLKLIKKLGIENFLYTFLDIRTDDLLNKIISKNFKSYVSLNNEGN